jgi:chorismate dehydratase
MLLNNEIDVGLVPVAVIPRLKQPHIISDFCIGCNGAVASVCLFSEVPLHEIKTLLLDYQSRTSAALTRILVKDYWKINPLLVETTEDFRGHIKGTTAGLIIGDRAFEQRTLSPFIYDLGLAWKEYTGLPFVFAAWVSNKKQDVDFVLEFNAANRTGIENIDEVVAGNPFNLFDLKAYYTSYVSYELDQKKMEGLNQFLEMLPAFKPQF